MLPSKAAGTAGTLDLLKSRFQNLLWGAANVNNLLDLAMSAHIIRWCEVVVASNGLDPVGWILGIVNGRVEADST